MEIGAIIGGLCGVSALCAGTLLVVAFFGLRLVGTNFSDLLDSFMGGGLGGFGGGGDEISEKGRRQPVAQTSKRGLRERAQALDFESAVQRHGGQAAPPDEDNAASKQGIPRAQSAPDNKPKPKNDSPLGEYRPPLNPNQVGSVSDEGDDRNLRSQGSNRRRDGYEIYDDEGNSNNDGGLMDNILDSF